MGPSPFPEITRFWLNVEPGRSDEECWPWAARMSRGYGVFDTKDTAVYAHRYAYMAEIGPIPEGLELDHLCRNPACVNPNHLEAVSHRENVVRSPLNGPKNLTHCPHGHSYTDENSVFWHGKLECRECYRLRSARNNERLRS